MVLARRSWAEPTLARLQLIARPPVIVACAGLGIAMALDVSIVRPALCMQREEEAAAGRPRASDGHWSGVEPGESFTFEIKFDPKCQPWPLSWTAPSAWLTLTRRTRARATTTLRWRGSRTSRSRRRWTRRRRRSASGRCERTGREIARAACEGSRGWLGRGYRHNGGSGYRHERCSWDYGQPMAEQWLLAVWALIISTQLY